MIRRFARPYARAIVDAAGSAAKANEVRGELMRFAKALETSSDLREFYANPGIELDAKLAVTKQLASKMKLSDLAAKSLEVFVRFHRINGVGAIVAALAEYVNRDLGIAVAEVRSAKSLSPEELEQLADTLSKRTGKRVELDVKTDPSLLGGFVAQIGSEIWDASVAGKINKFRETLA
ncbi:MAG: ATP synthase F1 subunit delta [Acidobacteria bacterium]|nr:ATP synthase F1 subunit delta [Acidobacteriota bacterium]MBV9475843.1 ATP synthase F1 subunit delta [Acidobacteriota bacterium]